MTPRLLTKTDLPAFIEHLERHAASGRADPMPHGPYDTDAPFDGAAVASWLPSLWEAPTSAPGWRRTIAVFVGSQIVGHADVSAGALHAERHRVTMGLGVELAWRRRGLGRALVEAAVALARATPGVAWVDLGVFVGNDGARRLYEAAGFVPVAVVRDRFRVDGRSIDDQMMTLSLGEGAPPV